MLEFRIPALPPSINQVYKVAYHQRRVYKSKEATDFEYLCQLTAPKTFPLAKKIKCEIEFHGIWHYKNGNIRRKDIQNLDKVLVDSLFKKMQIDDSCIFEHHLYKIEDEEEYTLVRLETIE